MLLKASPRIAEASIVCVLATVAMLTITDAVVSAVVFTNGRSAGGRSPDDFLKRFGYIDERLSLVTEESRRHGISSFQAMSSLPVTGALDSRTLRKMAEPRCANKDMGRRGSNKRPSRRKRYVVNFYKRWWFKCDLKWKLVMPSRKMDIRHVKAALRRAMDTWSRALNDELGRPVLSFTEASPYEPGDIKFRFVTGNHDDGNRFDGEGGVVAHAFLPPNGNVHFDDDEPWVLDNEHGRDFYWVALHEIGHALGLNHSDRREAIMFAFVKSYDPYLNLNQDDINGAKHLYPLRFCEKFSRQRIRLLRGKKK